jgi:hypothetical protein
VSAFQFKGLRVLEKQFLILLEALINQKTTSGKVVFFGHDLETYDEDFWQSYAVPV